MRFLLLLVALLAACLAAQAQLVPAATPTELNPPAAPAVRLAAPDTAAALHQYYAQKRHSSHVGLGVGGGLLVGGGILVGTANGYQDLGNTLTGVLSIMSSVPVLLINVARTLAYSKAQEQRTLQAWEHTHRLPRWSRRALSPKYTHY
jgi:hypothetical protein